MAVPPIEVVGYSPKVGYLSANDAAEMSMSDFARHKDLISRTYDKTVLFNSRFSWPSDVPLIASARYYEGGINFEWFVDFGQTRKGYRLLVNHYISTEEIERVRELTLKEQEDRSKHQVDWLKKACQDDRELMAKMMPKKKAPAPQIVPCVGCGLDTFGNPNSAYDKANARCFYCQELHDIRAAKPKKKRRWWGGRTENTGPW